MSLLEAENDWRRIWKILSSGSGRSSQAALVPSSMTSASLSLSLEDNAVVVLKQEAGRISRYVNFWLLVVDGPTALPQQSRQ